MNNIDGEIGNDNNISSNVKSSDGKVYSVNMNTEKKLSIRKFLEKTAKHMAQGELDSVYKMNIQLFPLDKRTQN
jgi:hypothetical protein